MPRAVAHYLPREMATLGLVELALSFTVIYLVIHATGIRTAGIHATGIRTAGALAPLPAVAGILPRGGVALAAVLALIIGGFAVTVGLYRPEACLDRKRLLLATGIPAIICLAGMLFARGGGTRNGNTLFIAQVIAAWLAVMALIRLAYGFAINRRSLTRRVLLIGDPDPLGALRSQLRSRGRLFDPLVHHDRTVSWPLLRQQGVWSVVVVSEPQGAAAEALLDCKLRGMRIFSGATFQESYLGRIDLEALTASDLLLGQNFGASRIAAVAKRLCDIVIATGMLVLMLPLMALTALAVKIESSGPVFYRQQRVGQFDKTFTLFKFRSMTADAEASGSPRWAEKEDPRITRVGHFIRATRIDELPQLANVIRGEMSMVGPRPERPHFVEQLARAIPFYRQRAYVKPGLTGWAQVNFPYGASVEDAREKLAYDIYYVKNRTIVLDLIILVSTIRVVLFREGAR
jgi:exopolysaccharide biosynthesis polyprenyl glycosylphosphotransferase